MTIEETMKLLALISIVDNRRADRNVARVWQVILHDIPLPYAERAHIEFRREQPGVYLEPGHIYERAKKYRDYNRSRVESAKRHGLLDHSVDRDFMLSLEALNLLSDYEKKNDRAMVGVISPYEADEALAGIRALWSVEFAALMPKAVEQ